MVDTREIPLSRRTADAEVDISGLATATPVGVLASVGQAGAHRYLRVAARVTDLFVPLAILAILCCSAWSYSTQLYVDAFSDAIVPVSGTPEQKIQSILDWMAHPPARFLGGAVGNDRNPIDTLNYKALLKVCGTATNAFINLADTSDLRARRLLLLDAHGETKHVDAEVWVAGHWFVIDPTFHTILRGADGRMLTRADLADPQIFSRAVRGIPHYDLRYSFERTTHIRTAGIPLIGKPAGRLLDSLLPGWQDSALVSLILERSSLLALSVTFIVALFLWLLRFSLRWYGQKRLYVSYPGIAARIRSGIRAFINPKGSAA